MKTNTPDKSKSATLLGAIISWNIDITNVSELLKDFPQRLGGGPIRKIIHLQRGHFLDIRGRATKFRHISAGRGAGMGI